MSNSVQDIKRHAERLDVLLSAMNFATSESREEYYKTLKRAKAHVQ